MSEVDVYRTRLLNKIEVVLLLKPESFWMMKAENQEPSHMAIQIARNKTGYPGPWSPAELVSVDLDTLGAPTIDDADPITAGKLWIRGSHGPGNAPPSYQLSQ
jgi:hypothetical protein